jgi:hypothetical protein
MFLQNIIINILAQKLFKKYDFIINIVISINLYTR